MTRLSAARNRPHMPLGRGLLLFLVVTRRGRAAASATCASRPTGRQDLFRCHPRMTRAQQGTNCLVRGGGSLPPSFKAAQKNARPFLPGGGAARDWSRAGRHLLRDRFHELALSRSAAPLAGSRPHALCDTLHSQPAASGTGVRRTAPARERAELCLSDLQRAGRNLRHDAVCCGGPACRRCPAATTKSRCVVLPECISRLHPYFQSFQFRSPTMLWQHRLRDTHLCEQLAASRQPVQTSVSCLMSQQRLTLDARGHPNLTTRLGRTQMSRERRT